MKKIALISVVMAFTQLATATQILSYYPETLANGKIVANIYNGFLEDGFSRAPNICFMGSAKGVCALIKAAQAEADRRYSSGDHGTFTIKSCVVDGRTVKLHYDRVNDYTLDADDLDIKLDLKACSDQN